MYFNKYSFLPLQLQNKHKHTNRIDKVNICLKQIMKADENLDGNVGGRHLGERQT